MEDESLFKYQFVRTHIEYNVLWMGLYVAKRRTEN